MTLFFFIGTEAELIKVFPLILKAREKNIDYRIIASGQNDISQSRVLKLANKGHIDLELSKEGDIKKTSGGLLKWYIDTRRKADRLIKEQLLQDADTSDICMIVHGDTISTVMGAYIGKRLKIKVAHVEAGLRSHNWLNPFPEEIDRMLVSRVASYHFAPGDEATENLKGKRNVINTEINTLYDSYKIALQQECLNKNLILTSIAGGLGFSFNAYQYAA